MTHPGQPGTPPQPTGGPQPGPQTPSGQPAPWGQPAPQGQPFGAPQQGQPFGGPSQGQSFGGPQPGPGVPPGPGSGAPGPFGSGAPGPFGPGRPGPAPKGAGKGRKIGGIVAAVAVAGGIAAFRLVDFGAPEVGDCIQQEAVDSVETVDCDSSEAQYRVVGTEADEVTEDEFYDTAYIPCTEFETAVQALWRGGESGDGTVYCVEPV